MRQPVLLAAVGVLAAVATWALGPGYGLAFAAVLLVLGFPAFGRATKDAERCASSPMAASPVSEPAGEPGSPEAPRPLQLGSVGAPALVVAGSGLSWLVTEVARIYVVALSGPFSPTEELCTRIRAAIQELRQCVAAAKYGAVQLYEPLDDVLFGRLLIAKDFEVRQAADLVRAYVDFRKELGGSVAPAMEVLRTGAFLLPFEDRRGRPVMFIRARYFDPTLPLHLVQKTFRAFMDAMILYFLRRRRSRLCERNPLEQYVCVIETEGAGWANVATSVLKMLVNETNLYYPDRLQEVIVMGVNTTIRAIWSVASNLVHPRTRKKVSLVAWSAAQATMERLVAREHLPSTYGGDAPAFQKPEDSESLGLEARVGAIAAGAWQYLEPSKTATLGTLRVAVATDAPGQPLDRRLSSLAVRLCASSPSQRPQLPATALQAPAEVLTPRILERSLNKVLSGGSPDAQQAVLAFAKGEGSKSSSAFRDCMRRGLPCCM